LSHKRTSGGAYIDESTRISAGMPFDRFGSSVAAKRRPKSVDRGGAGTALHR
jgi:hypothetical protein